MSIEGGRRATTLADVAREAGVSRATASKALNGRADVSATTRERVTEVARRLGFTPNASARGLLTGRSGTVGLLTSDLEGRFVLPILMGAEDAFGAGRLDVFLCDARGDAVRERHHLQTLLGRRVDGIIVVGDRTDVRRSIGRDLPVPVVYAYAPSDHPEDLSLTPDGVMGGALAAEHLLSLGRRRIVAISGDSRYSSAHDRLGGARAALQEAGLDLLGPAMFAEWTEHWGRAAIALALEKHPDLDAVLCGSDQVARGVLDGLRDAGRRVPEDVAVVGYDNWKLFAEGSRPGLTSIDSRLENLGREAAQHLFAAIEGEDVDPRTIRLPVELVVRGSTVPGLGG